MQSEYQGTLMSHAKRGERNLEGIENRHFGEGETVQLDGKSFVGCTFERCEVIYGGGETLWEAVNWSDCKFTLVGAANFTVQILKALGCTISGPPGQMLN